MSSTHGSQCTTIGQVAGTKKAKVYDVLMRYAVLDKREGQTPLMVLEQYRKEHALDGVPLTYAGRLDPMAEGKLIILIGDECKNRRAYDGLDKEYEVEILFGATTDTGDILGMADRCADNAVISARALKAAMKNTVGTITLPYPAFSSKPVEWKPLFEHARSGTLNLGEIPLNTTRIYTYSFDSLRKEDVARIRTHIHERIERLQIDEKSDNPYKDFRRNEIAARWGEILLDGEMQVAKARFVVSSGTYMRSLAPYIAEQVGACGLAYSIRRTRIGHFLPILRHGFWIRSY